MQPEIPDSEPHLGHLWIPFITLHVIGQVGIFLILLTNFFSKSVHFHPTIINFWVTWLIYSVSYSLQLYSHRRHETDSDRVGLLCRVQAVLVDGVPALAATAALIAVAQIWFSLQRAPSISSIFKPTQSETRRNRLVLASLIILPYIVFIAFGLSSYIFGMRYLSSTNVNELYCSLHRDEFSRYSIPAYCTAIVVVLIIFEIAIMVKYIRTRRKASDAFPLAENAFAFSLAVRVMVFSVVSLLVLCIGVFFMSNQLSSYPYMMQASLPLAAVITFGSQRVSHSNLQVAQSLTREIEPINGVVFLDFETATNNVKACSTYQTNIDIFFRYHQHILFRDKHSQGEVVANVGETFCRQYSLSRAASRHDVYAGRPEGSSERLKSD